MRTICQDMPIKASRLSTEEMIEKILKEEQEKEAQINKSQMESCPNCGRKFFPGRLALHLKSCKKDKPMKKTTLNL